MIWSLPYFRPNAMLKEEVALGFEVDREVSVLADEHFSFMSNAASPDIWHYGVTIDLHCIARNGW